jgi:hypothetical protein
MLSPGFQLVLVLLAAFCVLWLVIVMIASKNKGRMAAVQTPKECEDAMGCQAAYLVKLIVAIHNEEHYWKARRELVHFKKIFWDHPNYDEEIEQLDELLRQQAQSLQLNRLRIVV